jgi:hypothetical protein
MQAFKHTFEMCELMDLGFSEPKYTWSNCQEGNALVKEGLDRGVANFAWRNLFPEAEVVVNSIIYLDHAPLFISSLRHHGLTSRRP